MLPINRRNIIKELLLENKSVVVTDLSKRFHVAEETIRRDLKQLEEDGFLVRTYGGAFIQEGSTNKVNYNLRMEAYIKEKKIIADKALKLIDNGDSIYLDESTTCFYLAKKLKNKRITVITNSQIILNEISYFENIDLISIGGYLSKETMSFTGKVALDSLSNLYVDKAFVSCRKCSLEGGVTDSISENAQIRQMVLSHSNLSYLLVDDTKIDNTSLFKICDIKNLNGIICNKPFSSKWKEYCKNLKVNLY